MKKRSTKKKKRILKREVSGEEVEKKAM